MPTFLSDYADELNSVGDVVFAQNHPHAVLVVTGVVGALADHVALDRTLVTEPSGLSVQSVVWLIGRVFPLVKGKHSSPGPISVGRTPDNDVTVAESSISARHCLLRVLGAELSLTDAGSTNGTLVNGVRLRPRRPRRWWRATSSRSAASTWASTRRTASSRPCASADLGRRGRPRWAFPQWNHAVLRVILMPFRVFLAWAVLLASCVDLTQPPELRRPIVPSVDQDAGDDTAAASLSEAGALEPDSGEPGADVPAGTEPDAAPNPDAPVVDTAALPPDLAPDRGPPDAPLRGNGSACTAGSQCISGLCVDGFCCNLPCNGRCQACDVAGAEGKCTPIKAGDDPDNECDLDPVASCGRDGACDGQGACRRYAAGVSASRGAARARWRPRPAPARRPASARPAPPGCARAGTRA